MAIVWKGSKEIFLQDGYPLDTIDAGGFTRQLVYEGPGDAIKRTRPRIGATIEEFKDAGWIQTYTRQPLAGGKGRLSITMRREFSGLVETPQDFQPVYNVEWVEIDLPLSHNFLFRDAFYDGNGVALVISVPIAIGMNGMPVTQAQASSPPPSDAPISPAIPTYTSADKIDGDIGVLNSLIEQSVSTNSRAYAAWIAWATVAYGAGPAALFVKYLKRMWNGRDVFEFHAPVATITTRSTTLPKCNPCDRYLTTKPFPGCPDGYVWKRDDDRGTRTGRFGKWDRIIAWKGYEMIDREIYRPA